MLNIALFHPEIPQNTGNIARTCAVSGAHLHLVRPLGFDISEKSVRHAGLDYWNEVDITIYDSIEDFMKEHSGDELWFFSKKGRKAYTEVSFDEKDVFLTDRTQPFYDDSFRKAGERGQSVFRARII